MTVKDLILAWLGEAGFYKERIDSIGRALDGSAFANKPVGANVDSGPIRYIEKWDHETSFVRLDCEWE